MPNTDYKFMCDNCGNSQGRFGYCLNCKQPMTMYSRSASAPSPINYIS